MLQGTVDVEDERFYGTSGINLWGIARAAVATLGGGHKAPRLSPSSLCATPSCRRSSSTRPLSVRCARPTSPSRWRTCTPKTRSFMIYTTPSTTATAPTASRPQPRPICPRAPPTSPSSEAALLIGLPNSPSQYDPTVDPDLALSRRNKVLDNMLRLGHITQEEHDAARPPSPST